MRRHRKLLSLVLSAAMVVSLAPSDWGVKKASAADPGDTAAELPSTVMSGTFGPGTDAYTKDRFTWSLDPEGTLTIGEAADMPQTQSRMPDSTTATVSSLPWYQWHDGIKKVVFTGKKMSTIGNYTFYQYKALTTVDITGAPGLNQVGTSAFQDCESLNSVVGGISRFSTAIGASAFANTGFTELEFDQSVLQNGTLFQNCKKLKSITAPNLVEIKGNGTFQGCSELTTVKMDKLQLITNSSDGSGVFKDCTSLQTISLPALETAKNGNGGGATFYGCTSLQNVSLPKLQVGGGMNAGGMFMNCTALKEISLPQVTDMGRRAFYGCTSLEKVDCPNWSAKLDNDAFHDCTSLQVLSLPALTNLGTSYVFMGCTSLTGVNAPKAQPSGNGGCDFNETPLTWICGGGDRWSEWNDSDGGSLKEMYLMERISRLYLTSEKLIDSDLGKASAYDHIQSPVTIYVLPAVAEQMSMAPELNDNITLKTVKDAKAMQELIKKERILTLTGDEVVNEGVKPEEHFKTNWKNAITGEDTAGELVTAPPEYVAPTDPPKAGPVDVTFHIVDQSGAAVEGATFTLMQESYKKTVTEEASKGGKYKAAQLGGGVYDITSLKATNYNDGATTSSPKSFRITRGEVQAPGADAGWELESANTIKITLYKTATVKVKLQDESGIAVTAATRVQVAGSNASKTGTDGEWQAENVKDNTGNISITCKGYNLPTSLSITIKDGKVQSPAKGAEWSLESENTIKVVLKNALASLKVKAQDDSDSTALQGVTFTVSANTGTNYSNRPSFSATGVDGTSTATGVLEGSFTLTLKKTGYEDTKATIVVKDAKLQDPGDGAGWEKGSDGVDVLVKMKKTPTYSMKFLVKDGKGGTVDDATVTVKNTSLGGDKTATTAGGGKASVEGLIDTSGYTFEVAKEGYTTVSKSATLSNQTPTGAFDDANFHWNAAESQIEITIYEPVESQKVKVVDGDTGSAIPGATVTVYDAAGSSEVAGAQTTSETGEATMTATGKLTDGTAYVLEVTKEGYNGVAKDSSSKTTFTPGNGALSSVGGVATSQDGVVVIPLYKVMESLTVKLETEDGDAVTEDKVTLPSEGGFAKGTDATTYSASSLKDGTYTFTVKKPAEGYLKDVTVNVKVSQGKVVPIKRSTAYGSSWTGSTGDNYVVSADGRTVTIPLGKKVTKIRLALVDGDTGAPFTSWDAEDISTTNAQKTFYNKLFLGTGTSTSKDILVPEKVKDAPGVFEYTLASENTTTGWTKYYLKVNDSKYNSLDNKSANLLYNGRAVSDETGAVAVEPGEKKDGVQTIRVKMYKKLAGLKVKVHYSDQDPGKSYQAADVKFNNKAMKAESAAGAVSDASTDVVYTITGLTQVDSTGTNAGIALAVTGPAGYNDKTSLKVKILHGKPYIDQTGTNYDYTITNEAGGPVINVTLNKALSDLKIKVVEEGRSDALAVDTLTLKGIGDEPVDLVKGSKDAKEYEVSQPLKDNSSCTLDITKDGYYAKSSVAIKVSNGALADNSTYYTRDGNTAIISLKPLRSEMKLKLMNGSSADKKEAVSGAKMTLQKGGEDVGSLTDDSDGNYSLKSQKLDAGDYTIAFSTADGDNTFLKDYNTPAVKLTVKTDGTVANNSSGNVDVSVDSAGVINITLYKKQVMKVKVVELNGADSCLTDCTVKVGSGEQQKTLSYNAGGYYEAGEAMADGSYPMIVEKTDWQTRNSGASSAVSFSKGSASTVAGWVTRDGDSFKVTLMKKADLTVKVKDSKSSNALDGAAVSLKQDKGDPVSFTGNGSDGYKGKLDDGVYTATVSKEGYRPAELSVTVTEGKITDPAEAVSGTLEVSIKRIAAVSITVQEDGTNTPVKDAEVILSAAEGETHQAVYNDATGKYEASPADGTYTLTVKADGYLDGKGDGVTVTDGSATNGAQTIALKLVPVVVKYEYYKDSKWKTPAVDGRVNEAPTIPGYYYIRAKANGNARQGSTVSNTIRYMQLGTIKTEEYTLDMGTGLLTILKDLSDKEWKKAADVPWNEQRDYVKKVKFDTNAQTMTKIPAYAFQNMKNLTAIEALPASLNEIGGYALEGCSNLEMKASLHVNLGQNALKGCAKVTGSLTFPASVSVVATGAAYDAGIDEINFDGDINFFGEECFRGTAVKKLVLPNGAEALSTRFAGSCANLTSVTWPTDGKLKKIGSYAFQSTGITSVADLPASVETIDSGAFDRCQLDDIDLRGLTNLTTIGNQAFYATHAKTIEFPDSIKYLGGGFLSGCVMDEITMPNNVVSAIPGDTTGIMSGLNVKTVHYPEKFTTLPVRFWGGTETEVVIIPKSITKIEGATFQWAKKLKYVEFERDDYSEETFLKVRGKKIGSQSGDEEWMYPDLLFDRVSDGKNADFICVADGDTYDLLKKRQVLEEGGCIDWSRITTMTYKNYQSSINSGQQTGWAGFLTKPGEVAKAYDSFEEEINNLKRDNYSAEDWNRIQETVAEAKAMVSGDDISNYDKFANVQPAKEKVLQLFKELAAETGEKLEALLGSIDPELDYTEDTDIFVLEMDIDDNRNKIKAAAGQDLSTATLDGLAGIDKAVKDFINEVKGYLIDPADTLASLDELVADLKEADYTPESWKALQEALAELDGVRNATYNHEVEPVRKKIQEAYDGLVKVGGQSTSAPGEQNTPAPGGQNTPAPGGQNTPAPGGQNTPAPGGQNTPAPGGQQTAAPGGSNGGGSGNGGGNVTKPTPKPQKVTVKKVSLKKVKSSKKKTITVQWKKLSGVTGYQIQVCTSKKFKKGVKKYTVKKAKTTKKTIKKLKRKKKYYVRVRAYKKVGKKTYTGKWSKVKKVKVK